MGPLPPSTNRTRGRHKSIPEAYFVKALRLKLTGLGYQRVAEELERYGVYTSRGSVERLVKGLPPYHEYSALTASPLHLPDRES